MENIYAVGNDGNVAPAEILRELVSGVLGNRCQADVLLAIDAVLQSTEQTIVERTMQVAESPELREPCNSLKR